MSAVHSTRTIADLPAFDLWDSPDFGLDVEAECNELFRRDYQGPLGDGQGGIVVYRNEDVRAINLSTSTSHVNMDTIAPFYRNLVGDEAEGLIKAFADHTFTMRQPGHRPNKVLSTKTLTRSSVSPWAAAATGALQDRIGALAGQSGLDFVRDFCKPVVIDFWCRTLDLTHSESEAVYEAHEEVNLSFLLAPSKDEVVRASNGMDEYISHLTAALDRVLREGNPMMVALDKAYGAAADYRHVDSASYGFALTMLDGWATLAGGIAAIVHTISSDEDALSTLKADPTLAADALQEALRLHGPVATNPRAVVEDMELDGVLVPAGTTVTPLVLFANRDPLVFDEPNVFRLGRKNREHQVTFGGGAYICSGRHLVRMFGEAVVGALADGSLDVTTTGPITWQPMSSFHEITSMPATVGSGR